MPDYIREHLPEELSELPADLIYATHLYAHELSMSAPCRRSQEKQDRVIDLISNLWGPSFAEWPGWAVDLARWYHEDWVRFRGMQEDAMRWVQEKRGGGDEVADEEEDGKEAGELLGDVDDDGRMSVDKWEL